MSFLADVKGFSKSALKTTDTLITERTGEQYREVRNDDGTVTRTLVGKLEISDTEAADIIEGLKLGSQHVADDLDLLKEHKVTHIVNAASSFDNKFPEEFSYLRLDINDLADTVITDTFPQVFPFINKAIQDGGCVLVHCNLGVSRSASIVIGYLMYSKGMSFEEAFSYVKTKRSAISPNYGFRSQLAAYKPKK